MTVYNNMAYGLRNRGMAEPEIKTRVEEAARILELAAMLERKPRQLSGGQRQPRGDGRAIVRQPKVFLFDEPLSNLDAKLRIAMRVEIRKLQRPPLHDLDLRHPRPARGDDAGRYSGGHERRPGRADRQPARYLPEAGDHLRRLLHRRPADESDAAALRRAQIAIGRRWPASAKPAILGIRPEDFVITNETVSGGVALGLTVEAIERVGAETFIYGTRQHEIQGVAATPGELPPGEVIVRIPGAIGPAIGERIRALPPATSCIFFTRRRPQTGGAANPVIPGWSEGPEPQVCIAHRGISRFSGAQLRTVVRRFAPARNDGCGSPPRPIYAAFRGA